MSIFLIRPQGLFSIVGFENPLLKFACYTPLWTIIGIVFYRNFCCGLVPFAAPVLILFALGAQMAIFAGSVEHVSKIASFFVTYTTIILFAWSVSAILKPDEVIKIILTSTVIMVTLNFLLFVFGVYSFNIFQPTSGLSPLPFRVKFALATGVNNYSPLVGISIIACMCFFKISKGFLKIIYGACLFVSAIVLVLIETRMVVVSVIMSIVIRRIIMRYRKILHLFLIGLVLSSVILTLIYLFSINIDSVSPLNRSEGGSFLSGRELIWGSVFSSIDFSLIRFLFGYGYYGQFVSGASSDHFFLSVVTNLSDDPEFTSVHNTYLQTFLDSGLCGVIILCSFAWLTIVRLLDLQSDKSIANREYYTIALLVILFLAFTGITEVSLSYYFTDVFLVLNLLIFSTRKSFIINRSTS